MVRVLPVYGEDFQVPEEGGGANLKMYFYVFINTMNHPSEEDIVGFITAIPKSGHSQRRKILEIGMFQKKKILNQSGSLPVQGALYVKDMILHIRHGGTAKDQYEF